MNVYDFDKTIYAGDSTIDFYMYCLRKKPFLTICIFKQIYSLIKYKLKIINKVKFKEDFFCFLRHIDNVDDMVIDFWNANENKIKEWYKINKREDDIIISASPYFLLKEICERQNIILIASKVDKHNGIFVERRNCYGKDKVVMLKEKYGNVQIEQFYSDSKSDLHLAKLAKKAFLVKGNIVQVWDVNK